MRQRQTQIGRPIYTNRAVAYRLDNLKNYFILGARRPFIIVSQLVCNNAMDNYCTKVV